MAIVIAMGELMRRWIKFASIAAGVLALAGCSAVDAVNAFAPNEGYSIIKDVRYGAGARRHRMDIYVPDGAGAEAPTVVFFYGGSWKAGDKADYKFVGQALASKGYRVVIPDYRLYPDVRYPAFLDDAAAAIAEVRASTGNQGAKPGPIYLAGHSAGAYIAVMTSVNPRWLGAYGLRSCKVISATVGLAGPYDFLPLKAAHLKEIFGPKADRARTQPIYYVDGQAPPLLLISGLDDTTVDPGNTRRLAAKVTRQGGVAETVFYADISHVSLVGSLAAPFRGLAPTLEAMDAFFRRHPKPTGCPGFG